MIGSPFLSLQITGYDKEKSRDFRIYYLIQEKFSTLVTLIAAKSFIFISSSIDSSADIVLPANFLGSGFPRSKNPTSPAAFKRL